MEDIRGRQTQKQGASFRVLPAPGLFGLFPTCPHGGALGRAGIWIPEAEWNAGRLWLPAVGSPFLPRAGRGLILPIGAGWVLGETQMFAQVKEVNRPGNHREALLSCLPRVTSSLERGGEWGHGCTALRGMPWWRL